MACRTRSTANSAWPVSASTSSTRARAVGVEELRDLAVEVGRNAVADVGLDQALGPVAGRGLSMKRLERDDEGRHRLLGADPHAVEVALQQLVVPELGRGQTRERCLVLERRCHPRVVGEPLEGDELGVGQHPEQVGDGGEIGRIPQQVDLGILLVDLGILLLDLGTLVLLGALLVGALLLGHDRKGNAVASVGESLSSGRTVDSRCQGRPPGPASRAACVYTHDSSARQTVRTAGRPLLRGSVLTTFAELGIVPETAGALEAVGITIPFPVQALAIPLALTGTDLIGQARTGTGKTLAFGAPLLQLIELVDDHRPRALVVVPTRELAIQVAADLVVAGKGLGARVLAVYGGRSYEPQVAALKAGIDVVSGTPGRLLDLARQGHLDLSDIQILVLDEADEMLDLGFLPDVERILALTPASRQTMLFSATMPGEVISLSRKYLKQPTRIRAEEPDEGRTVPETAQFVYRAHSMDKPEVLARILQADGRGLAMVFCHTKRHCDKLAADLTERGFAAAAVHGDLGQGQREQALRAFRAGKVDVLVATDVAARGIDVEGVTHVINYSCPDDEKTYLHRIGRTGRAGASGVAVTLVDWDDLARWKSINTPARPARSPTRRRRIRPRTNCTSSWASHAG